jgi:hypothetical protein
VFGSNRGIPAKDLRPFSIEDPHGYGLKSPAEERLKRRIRREGTRASVQAAQEVLQEAKRKAAPPRAARPPSAQAARSARSEKRKSIGCLPVLVVLALLYWAGTFIVPPVWNLVEQQIILHTGAPGVAQVSTVGSSNFSINDDTVYEVTLRVVPEVGDAYMATVKQPFTGAEAKRLQVGTWVQIRIKVDDPSKIAVSRVGIDDPTLDRLPPDSVVDRPTPAHPAPPAGDEEDMAEPDQDDSNDLGSAAIDPNEDQVAPEESDASVPLVCLQARACCKVAGGSTCEPFTNPNVPTEMCQRALQGFSRLAAAMGKTCSGPP